MLFVSEPVMPAERVAGRKGKHINKPVFLGLYGLFLMLQYLVCFVINTLSQRGRGVNSTPYSIPPRKLAHRAVEAFSNGLDCSGAIRAPKNSVP